MHASPPPPLEVVQITDAHLGAEPGGQLLGMDTDHSLGAVLAEVRRHHSRIDLLLATGDLSDHGAVSAYQRFGAAVDGLAAQQMWLPGNHDEATRMRVTLADSGRYCGHRLLGGWLVIGLDSSVPGEVGGALAAAELERLDGLLAAHPETPALVCLHHPVLAVGCRWLDQQRLANAAELLQCLQRHPQARILLSGHVHQSTEQRSQGLRVLTSPSTCIQFAPNSDSFRVDTCPPGYRWLRLHSDGHVETGVRRVSGVDFVMDLDATGY